MVRYAYEDFSPGQVIELGTVHVDRAQMLAFAQAFDPQPFHIDEEAAKSVGAGRAVCERLVHLLALDEAERAHRAVRLDLAGFARRSRTRLAGTGLPG